MAAVFSFGSFGDIITIIQLSYSLAQALRDTGDSSSECQDLVEYLNAFGRNLDNLRPYLSGRSRALDPAAVQQIHDALGICDRLINEFMTKNVRIRDPSGNKIVDMTRRVRWAVRWVLRAKDDAVELRQRLMAVGDIITRTLCMSIWIAVGDDQHKTHKVVSVVQQTQRPRQLPAEVDYQTITFVDVLNQKRPVPFEVCHSRADFQAFLSIYHRQRAGKTFVEREYYILKTIQGEPLQVGERGWSARIKPGVVVQMSACVLSLDANPGRCPTCATDNSSRLRTIGENVQCQYCATVFRMATSDWELSRILIPKLGWLLGLMRHAAVQENPTMRQPHLKQAFKEALSRPIDRIIKPIKEATEVEHQFLRNVVVIPVSTTDYASGPFANFLDECMSHRMSSLLMMIQWIEAVQQVFRSILPASSSNCQSTQHCSCAQPDTEFHQNMELFEELESVGPPMKSPRLAGHRGL